MKLLTINNGTLYKYLYDGGYCSFSTAQGNQQTLATCHYYNRDHLGNIREVIAENGTVEQVTHYYPFGAPYSDSSVINPALQPYKYNGKEFDATHKLFTYDYGARQYDPLLTVWHGVDPMCEKDYRIGVNVYCHNNPVNLIDPNGMDDYFDEDGEFIWRTDVGTAVKIMHDESFKNIREVDFTNNENAIQNIGSYYLAKSDKAEFSLKVSNNMGGDVPYGAVFSNNAGKANYNLYLTNGYVNPSLGNCYDFECITYHESIHRYDDSTHNGTIGEANDIIRTAQECPAWNLASNNYILSQAAYAAGSLNSYGKENGIIPRNIVQNLNNAFTGYATFELVNNIVAVSYLLQNFTIWGNRK